MDDFLRQTFNDQYYSKVVLGERLELLYGLRKKAIEKNNKKDILMINGFMDIISEQVEEAEKYFNSNIFEPNDKAVILAKGIINLKKAEKENNYELYESTVKELGDVKELIDVEEQADSSLLMIKWVLSHAYYMLGEKRKLRIKKEDEKWDEEQYKKAYEKAYKKAYEIVDSVIENYKDITDENKKIIAYFYNEKGNILLQLADFDEENQFLMHDENQKLKIFDGSKYGQPAVKMLDRNECLKIAEECFNEAKNLNENFTYAYNGLGNVYRERKMLKKAIEYYSLSSEKDKEFFYPISYKGDCYRLLGMYSEAEESFKKAIQISGRHTYAIYGLGKVYYELGNRTENRKYYFEEAKKYFTEVTKNDESFPYAWFDLGRTMVKLESYEISKLNLDHILDTINPKSGTESGKVSNNCKREHKKEIKEEIKGYYDSLKEYYNKVCDDYSKAKDRFKNKYYFEKVKREHWENTINNCIKDGKSKIRYFNKLKNVGIKVINDKKSADAFKKALFYTISTGIEEQAINNSEQFKTTFLSYKPSNKTNDEDNEINDKDNGMAILHILRRWNSYTPIIADNSKGGGYFLQYKGKGIVIDPGHNFIDNFKKANFKFADIDSILISHSHDDHTADLESIINLLYRYNKELKKYVIPRRIAKEKGVATTTITNEKGANYSEYKKLVDKSYGLERKRIKLYVSDGVFIKYSGIFKYDEKCKIFTESSDVQNKEVKDMIDNINKYKGEKPKEEEKKNSDPEAEDEKIVYYVSILHNKCEKEVEGLKLKAIKAYHQDLFNNESSLGFIFEFDTTALIYTGDTGWKDIEDDYRDNKNKLGNKNIILLSHIGGFKAEEIGVLKKGGDKECYYENHLGRVGMVEINNLLEPKICIISEFGEEFKYNRIGIAKVFNESYKSSTAATKFLPADIGLSIDLNGSKIYAFTKIDDYNHKIICGKVEPEKISVGEHKKENSLFYFDNGSLTENQCLQALEQDYEIISPDYIS